MNLNLPDDLGTEFCFVFKSIAQDFWSPRLPTDVELRIPESEKADRIRLAEQESDFKLRGNGYRELGKSGKGKDIMS